MTKAPGRRDHVGATVHARWWDRHADDLAGLAALAQVPRSPGDGVTADDALAAARARLRQTSDTRP